MSNSKNGQQATPWAGILTLVFVVLKLTGEIDWSWWWVLSPLWIGALIVLTILVVVGIVAWVRSS